MANDKTKENFGRTVKKVLGLFQLPIVCLYMNWYNGGKVVNWAHLGHLNSILVIFLVKNPSHKQSISSFSH